MRPLVICCSQRFKDDLSVFVHFLEKEGVLVVAPNFKYHRKRQVQKSEQARLRSASYKSKVRGMVLAHLDRLAEVGNMGGICLIFNPHAINGQKKKFGYIGSNTLGEIFTARALSMPVIMLRPHEEECIMALVPRNDRKRIFTVQYPKADPDDHHKVWKFWLKRWLQ